MNITILDVRANDADNTIDVKIKTDTLTKVIPIDKNFEIDWHTAEWTCNYVFNRGQKAHIEAFIQKYLFNKLFEAL